MKPINVTVVRIYLTEEKAHLENLLKKLHDDEKVRGVTAFRGISGFGSSGRLHTSKLLDLSFNLPIVVEFYDEPDRVKRIIQHLSTFIDPGHIVSWPAQLAEEE